MTTDDRAHEQTESFDQLRLAAELFNGVWDLLERDDRTPADDARMVHMAHASAHHWLQVGTSLNEARGEWLCLRVYAVLGRSEPARYHAGRALTVCEANAIVDFDLAYCFEALARAASIAENWHDAEEWRARAEAALDAIEDGADRDLVAADLATIAAGPRSRPREPRRTR